MKHWVVNVTSAQGGEKVIPVTAATRTEAFAKARDEYKATTGRDGIQLSIKEA